MRVNGGSYIGFFRLFWLFTVNFDSFRVNGSYFYSGFYFYPKLIRNKNHRFFLESVGFLFFGILRLFSLRTMVLIKNECTICRELLNQFHVSPGWGCALWVSISTTTNSYSQLYRHCYKTHIAQDYRFNVINRNLMQCVKH